VNTMTKAYLLLLGIPIEIAYEFSLSSVGDRAVALLLSNSLSGT